MSEEAAPRTFVATTKSEEIDCSWAKWPNQERVRLVVLIYGRSTSTPPSHGSSSISIAIRACKSREAGRWAAFTPELESELRRELRSYTRLGDNWDGEGAKAPSQEAVNDALTFLDERPGDIPLPYPEEGTDGDVGVYWDNGHAQVFAEVSFEGDGTCAYFAAQGVPGAATRKCGGDGLRVDSPWPDDLLRILRTQDST